MSLNSNVYRDLEGTQLDPKYLPLPVDRDLLLETANGKGQHVGDLNVGMLGLCGPEARERALARLAARDEG